MQKTADWFGELPKQERADILRKRSQIDQRARESMLTYGEEYFDGGTPWGYGKYQYDGRFSDVVDRMIKHYKLDSKSKVLEIGCAKGYLLYEFYKKGIHDVHGIDISDYAIANVPEELKGRCHVGSADDLSRWADKSVDFLVSKDTLHNLTPEGVDRSLSEIARVCKGPAFIQLSSYKTESEKKGLTTWVITIKTIRSATEWVEAFNKAGYKGDYNFLCYDYSVV